MKSSRHRGNILFLILLAVVLFAALSYAVTSSMRGGGKDVSGEQAQALAAALVQKGTLYASTIDRLMLVNDCKDNQISFQNDVDTDYTNNNAPTTPKKCHVFDPAGGGLSWENPDPKALTAPPSGIPASWVQNNGKWIFYGGAMVVGAGTTGTTSASSDLILYLPFLSKPVCDAINKSLGIASDAIIKEQVSNLLGANSDKFKGTYSASNGGVGELIGNNSFPPNLHYGCIMRGDTGNPAYYHYAYYHLLIAR